MKKNKKGVYFYNFLEFGLNGCSNAETFSVPSSVEAILAKSIFISAPSADVN